jgi:hypothetical protein
VNEPEREREREKRQRDNIWREKKEKRERNGREKRERERERVRGGKEKRGREREVFKGPKSWFFCLQGCITNYISVGTPDFGDFPTPADKRMKGRERGKSKKNRPVLVRYFCLFFQVFFFQRRFCKLFVSLFPWFRCLYTSIIMKIHGDFCSTKCGHLKIL